MFVTSRYLRIVLFDCFRDLGNLLSPFLTGYPDILKELMLSSFSVFYVISELPPNIRTPSQRRRTI